MPSFVKEVITLSAEVLADAAFKKRREGMFSYELPGSPGVLGWLGLNHAVEARGAVVDVAPIVGVRHRRVEELLRLLEPEQFSQPFQATCGIALGYLMPEPGFRNWRYKKGEDGWNARVVADMVAAIRAFGVPYMEDNTELDQVMLRLEREVRPISRYRLPTVLLLLGEKEKACALVRRELEELVGETYNAAVTFRAFAERFLAHAEAAS